MKKKLLLIIAVIVLLVVVAAGLLITKNSNSDYKVSKQQQRFMSELNDANTKVWYYGDLDPEKEVTLNYEKVTEFTDETIGDANNQYARHMIVIFDFDGKMDVSNEELLLIKDYCENKYYDLLYYGTAHMEQFKECAFFTRISSEEHGFTYTGSYWLNRTGKEEYLNPYLCTGNWVADDERRYDTEDKHLMWTFVIQFMVDILNDSYGEL